MTRRATLWRVVASLFTLINLGGAGIAAVRGEGLHTALHVALLLLGAYVVWRLSPRAARQESPAASSANDRLEQLQQSVDAVALEVERIGEAQRFTAKLQQERTQARS